MTVLGFSVRLEIVLDPTGSVDAYVSLQLGGFRVDGLVEDSWKIENF